MNIRQLRPVKHRKGVLTLECSVVANFGEQYFEVLVSVPNTEGVAQAAWPMKNGFLDAPQASDLTAWVGQMVIAAIWGQSGQQEVLPL